MNNESSSSELSASPSHHIPSVQHLMIAACVAAAVTFLGYAAGNQRSTVLWGFMTGVHTLVVGLIARHDRLSSGGPSAWRLPLASGGCVGFLLLLSGSGFSTIAMNVAWYTGFAAFFFQRYHRRDVNVDVRVVGGAVLAGATFWTLRHDSPFFVCLAETLGLIGGAALAIDMASVGPVDGNRAVGKLVLGPAFGSVWKVVAVVAVVTVLGAAVSGTAGKARRSGSSGSSRTLTPSEAYDIMEGCCSGAGGRYSSSGQDCVIPSSLEDAYVGCVGEFDVIYPSGNVGQISGASSVRPI